MAALRVELLDEGDHDGVHLVLVGQFERIQPALSECLLLLSKRPRHVCRQHKVAHHITGPEVDAGARIVHHRADHDVLLLEPQEDLSQVQLVEHLDVKQRHVDG